ncbi:group 1 truncated hemoglobin [Patulibacter brassicae]|uniref:Group 1 truncated hemoglobin n=1 Tax=Patulibacter brassicae TaxID=1705717 RepID=A0ABU4VM45_9ACTN|nr:group 1 truncated hemoglobin [Patulibacter brassicae]MDX8151865.1 group 1 truncated hemoglobin [Patulibacter brassicae]
MTLLDEIGGPPAVAAAVDRFYERVWEDPALAPYFEGTDRDALKRHQRQFLTVALRGRGDEYLGRAMDRAHAGLGITNAAFDRVVGHLVATLGELGVGAPQIEAIGAALAPLRSAIVTVADEAAA